MTAIDKSLRRQLCKRIRREYIAFGATFSQWALLDLLDGGRAMLDSRLVRRTGIDVFRRVADAIRDNRRFPLPKEAAV